MIRKYEFRERKRRQLAISEYWFLSGRGRAYARWNSMDSAIEWRNGEEEHVKAGRCLPLVEEKQKSEIRLIRQRGDERPVYHFEHSEKSHAGSANEGIPSQKFFLCFEIWVARSRYCHSTWIRLSGMAMNRFSSTTRSSLKMAIRPQS